MWDFELPKKRGKPLYMLIADHLEQDIVSGELPPGGRIMPQRELAARTGVTVATVTKAYGEAERRGLVKSMVGRGTFVIRSHPPSLAEDGRPDELVDLAAVTPLHGTDPSVKPILQKLIREHHVDELMRCRDPLGLPEYRTTGAQWLQRSGIDARLDTTLISNGGQHALSSTLRALFQPGDRIAASQLSNPGFKMLAQREGLELVGVKRDEEGLVPEHLCELCSRKAIRGLFVTNPGDRPTSGRRGESLRKLILRYGLVLLEDGSYSWLDATRRPALSSMLPEDSVYFSGIGPSIYSGLRVGFVQAPAKYYNRIAQRIVEDIWAVAPLSAAIICEAIRNGSIDISIKSKLREISRRAHVLRETMADFPITYVKDDLCAWLSLPGHWPSRDFEALAEQHGVKVLSAERFQVGQQPAPNAVRLSLTGPKDIPSLKRGLDIVTGLLKKETGFILPIF